MFIGKTFWAYLMKYVLLSNTKFQRSNDAQRISSMISHAADYQLHNESNVYDNRFVNSYTVGIDALLEADKIKTWLFDVEHDLWEY
jgi:hypothetical protein